MQRLVEIGLSNALAATLLACLVLAITRWVRRPTVRHALWVLVLLKLVTPSFVTVPTPIHLEWVKSAETAPAPAASTPRVLFPHTATYGAGASQTAIPPAPQAIWWQTIAENLPAPAVCLLIVWVSTVLVVLLWRMAGVARFAWGLRQAWPADDELQIEAERLAHGYGLPRSPRVLLIPGCANPMLWAVGPTVRILFPAQLLRRLDPEAQSTLLAHELAHYRRGDHWVRMLELVVSSLFWWHPAVWWARRQIEMAEEECCDAWVVTQFPHMPRRYAEALLDAVDFLHEKPSALPALASGVGNVPFLKHRLMLIMRGTVQPRMNTPMRCIVLALAATFLPLRPSLVQSASLPSEPPKRVVTKAPPSAAKARPSRRSTPRVARSSTNRGPTRTQPAVQIAPPIEAEEPDVDQSIWVRVKSPSGDAWLTKDDQSRVVLRNELWDKTLPLEAGEEIMTAAFSPNSSLLATGGMTKLLLWDVLTGRTLAELDLAAGGLQSLAFTPDGRRLITGTTAGRVCVWDLASRKLLAELPASSSSVNCLCVSPDGTRLVVATGTAGFTADPTRISGRVTVWSLPDLTLLHAFDCDTAIGAVAFRDQGQVVIGGGWDGMVTLWDLRTGHVQATGTVKKDAISITRFSGDCRALSDAVVELPPEPMFEAIPLQEVDLGLMPILDGFLTSPAR